MSKSADRFIEGTMPVIGAAGSGAWLSGYLPDGTSWNGIDWVGALGAASFGYAHPAVVEAVTTRLRGGWLFSLPHKLEVETSERFCAAVPAGKDGCVRWVKTGTESCLGAIAVARAYTGRDLILISNQSYHGWADWYRVTKPVHPGAPEFLKQGVGVFPFNNSDALEHADWNRVAAVMLEPCLTEAPLPGFLQSLRELTQEHEALLIFDEMILGGRMAYGGGSEYFRVTPDLACYGKAIGGGVPVACVVGRRDIMQHAWVVSGTFGGDALGLAAVDATLSVYKSEDIIARIWHAGEQLQKGFNLLARSLGVPVTLSGAYPFRLKPAFTCDEPKLALSLLIEELAARNVLWHPAGINPGAAHGPKEIALTLEAVEGALRVVGEAISRGIRREDVKGQPYQDAWRTVSS